MYGKIFWNTKMLTAVICCWGFQQLIFSYISQFLTINMDHAQK